MMFHVGTDRGVVHCFAVDLANARDHMKSLGYVVEWIRDSRLYLGPGEVLRRVGGMRLPPGGFAGVAEILDRMGK